MCLYQSYERREIDKVDQIDGTSNPADAIIKLKACLVLRKLIETNKFDVKLTKWVERKASS